MSTKRMTFEAYMQKLIDTLNNGLEQIRIPLGLMQAMEEQSKMMSCYSMSCYYNSLDPVKAAGVLVELVSESVTRDAAGSITGMRLTPIGTDREINIEIEEVDSSEPTNDAG